MVDVIRNAVPQTAKSDPDQPGMVAGAADRFLESVNGVFASSKSAGVPELFRRLRGVVTEHCDLFPPSRDLLPLIDEVLAGEGKDNPLAMLDQVFAIVGAVKQACLAEPKIVLAELAGLADWLTNFKPADPVEVLRGLRELTDDGRVLPPLIAQTIVARARGDISAALDSANEILHDPALVRQIFPSRRRPRRGDTVSYRVRIDLRGTKPPVWRRLELASDLHLDELHTVIQVAFDWSDTHLYLFASGSGPYERDAEHYLCPYEAEEGQVGIPAEEVRLDEVLTDAGDKLFYVYDFGDDWKHLIKLEAVAEFSDTAPRTQCTAGRRPGPLEDCGGVDAYEAGAEGIPFDLTEINKALSARRI